MEKQAKIFIALAAVLIVASGALCAYRLADGNGSDDMWQHSTLESLLQGNYDGTLPVGELKKHGDFGLGTYDRLNGEMIVLDGVVYQALWDGSVIVADDGTLVPFAAVAYFKKEFGTTADTLGDYDDLKSKLNTLCGDMDKYYVAKVSGTFDLMVRSEKAQDKPYKSLADVLAQDETRYTYSNLEGTVVAVYCPPSAGTVNQQDWHFHFISADGTKGGHILEIYGGSNLVLEAEKCEKQTVDLPCNR